MKVFVIILAIIIFCASIIPWVYSITKSLQFSANCGDYLKLAADANDINMAEKHLSTAITYLEEHDLTSGYTKVFRYYPSNDIGLWYENLKTAQEQLRQMQAEGYTELEQSNMLMKLRETICNDDGSLTHPMGISFAHNFSLMFWLNMLLWLPCWFIGGFLFWFAVEEM